LHKVNARSKVFSHLFLSLKELTMTSTLITGGNTGIGFETARALAAEGHDLIITSRSLAAAQNAAKRIRSEVPAAVLHPLQLDLSDFVSVREFAAEAAAIFPQLDIALFNAGVMTPPYTQTGDGFELQFQANYLGHFQLYQLLRGALLANGGKVISVSSLASERSECTTLADFENLARVVEADYDGIISYRASKLAQVNFTVELDRREGAQGLRSYAIHPGIVNTDLFYRDRSQALKTLARPFVWLGYKTGRILTPEQGAATSIYLATNDVLPSGAYWADEAVRPMNPVAQDEVLGRDLWAWSESLLPV
jgi:NAD(P)-dependent dehydrogenase (short-subunit alcohol dehydrogenase family)